MIGYDPSYWEDQAVADLVAANIPELTANENKFQIEVLGDQVDFEKDQLNRAVPHILVSWIEANHDQGFVGADPINLAFVAVVPGGRQRERRSLAINALVAIANWMRSNGTPYQPIHTTVMRVHPIAIATLIASRVE